MERFGKFELLMKIGSGGMAEIFLARPTGTELSKLVAVKRILPKFTDDRAFREMFRREGEIALRFRHHAIVGVHELGVVDGAYYLSMEYFPGKTLSQVITAIRNSPSAIDLGDKLLIIKHVAEALHYIHEFSDYGDTTEIIHRDISPQNILAGFNGTAKLIDFGVAKFTKGGDGTSSTSIKGKMAYMSPEQIRGDALTKQTDIFSLGIVLWEVLAGKKLFTGKSIDEVAVKLEACFVPSLAGKLGIDAEFVQYVDRLCGKALRRNPNDRYSSAAEFALEIDSVMKRMNLAGNQKRLANALQFIFKDEYDRLCLQLKQHESATSLDSDTVEIVNPFADVKVAPLEILKPSPDIKVPQSAPIKSYRRDHSQSASISRAPHAKGTKSSALVVLTSLTVVVACILGASFFQSKNFFKRFKNVESEVVIAPVAPETLPQPTPSISAIQPVLELKPSQIVAVPRENTPEPTPAKKLVSQPTPKPAVQMPQIVEKRVEPPKPKVAIKPKENLKAKEVAKAKEPVKLKETALKQKETPKARVVAKSKEPAKRAVASKQPVEKFAFVTVLADPDAQIFIDGKDAGMEVVNNFRVPAEKSVTIKIVSRKTNQSTVKKIELKPFSRHVLDLSNPVD